MSFLDGFKEKLKKIEGHSFLKEYIKKTKSGEILIGRELKQQLEIIEEDFNNPKYYFDLDYVHKKIIFIESFCKHFTYPFAGKPFLLTLWEKAFLEAVYGFYHTSNKLRKYNRAILLIARKNGKSIFAAADVASEIFLGEMGQQISCASNNYKQSDITFQAIKNMLSEDTFLKTFSRNTIDKIKMGDIKGKYKKGKFSHQNKSVITKMSDKQNGGFDGQSINYAILDEIWELKNNELADALYRSTSGKPNWLILEITTEGTINDGYLDNRLIFARRKLNREIGDVAEDTLVWLYTQDSEEEIWQDSKTWVKSNPNLGVAKSISWLSQTVEKSKILKSDRIKMLAKDFNIKQNRATSWLAHNEVLDCFDKSLNLKDFENAYYVSGNDFAITTDLCSTTILWYNKYKKVKTMYTHYWVTEAKAQDSQNKMNLNPELKDYYYWRDQGFCTIVEGNQVDVSIIADWHFDLYNKYKFKPLAIGYDNRFAKDFQNRIKQIFGDDVSLENIPQKPEIMSSAMRSLELDLKMDKAKVFQNEICKWNFEETGIQIKANSDFMMPIKISRSSRIDGTVSKIIAYSSLSNHISEFEYFD